MYIVLLFCTNRTDHWCFVENPYRDASSICLCRHRQWKHNRLLPFQRITLTRARSSLTCVLETAKIRSAVKDDLSRSLVGRLISLVYFAESYANVDMLASDCQMGKYTVSAGLERYRYCLTLHSFWSAT